MIIERLDPSQDAAYEAFLKRHDDALFYHSPRYRDLLLHLLGCAPHYLIVRAEGQIVGCLPMMDAEGPFGRVLNSLPFFGSNGGVLAEAPAVKAFLWRAYQDLCTRSGLAAATVISNPLSPEPDDLEFDYKDERVGYMTGLEDVTEPNDVLQRVDDSARRNIRKAQALEIEAYIDNGAVNTLATLHWDNMKVMGARAKPPEFFAALPRFFRAGLDYNIYVARLRHEVVAALLVFYYNRTVEYFIPAIRHESRSDQPLAAILFRGLADAAQMGFKRWNWGGCWPTQIMLQRFKRKWGGVERRYSYHVTVNDRALLSATSEQLAAAYPGFYVVPYRALATAA